MKKYKVQQHNISDGSIGFVLPYGVAEKMTEADLQSVARALNAAYFYGIRDHTNQTHTASS